MEINICPQWLLVKFRVPREVQTHVALLFSSVLALIISPLLTRVPHFCLMQRLLGIPCPGCGVMHALIAILQLHLGAAWSSNPAGIVLALYLFLQICGRSLVLASMLNANGVARASQVGESIVVAALFSVWVTRILTF